MGWKIDVTLSLHSALVRPQTAIEKIPHDHQEALPYSDQVLAEVAQKSRWIFHFGDIQKPSGHGPGQHVEHGGQRSWHGEMPSHLSQSVIL